MEQTIDKRFFCNVNTEFTLKIKIMDMRITLYKCKVLMRDENSSTQKLITPRFQDLVEFNKTMEKNNDDFLKKLNDENLSENKFQLEETPPPK